MKNKHKFQIGDLVIIKKGTSVKIGNPLDHNLAIVLKKFTHSKYKHIKMCKIWIFSNKNTMTLTLPNNWVKVISPCSM